MLLQNVFVTVHLVQENALRVGLVRSRIELRFLRHEHIELQAAVDVCARSRGVLAHELEKIITPSGFDSKLNDQCNLAHAFPPVKSVNRP
jgi:hypothetical protein